MFELVTPAGREMATRDDISRLEDRMDARFAAVDSRFVSLEERMDTRFAAVDSRLVSLEERMDARFSSMQERLESLEHRLVGVFERRIADAVTSQTRTLVLSQLAALVAIAGLAFGLR